ncbi:MAG: F510_1955 family glycosylhydrolase [Actinomycetota bacterium]
MTKAALIGLAAALSVAASSCGGEDQADTAAPEPGIHHVHGLGIDPADGDLYAATHYGLFRVPADGEAQRVGDSFQDTMGFTVVGPGRFLGSGHPDLQDPDLPPLLGLIESGNGGRTWEPISLLGEADFHALVFRHGLVYGYDATNERFMVSADREAWEMRSQPPGLLSFAVDPENAEHVLATTSSGVLTSGDGGRTWDPVSAPPLAFLSWADDGTLAAAGANEVIYLSADGGMSWAATGSLPGRPEALLAIDARTMIAAVQERGLYDSSDGGRSWNLRYRDEPT